MGHAASETRAEVRLPRSRRSDQYDEEGCRLAHSPFLLLRCSEMAVPEDAQRWLDEARADAETARYLLEGGRYNTCAFMAQQTAEKAIKALLRSRGESGWGQDVEKLAERLTAIALAVPTQVIDAAHGVDQHYSRSRYPDASPSGIPSRIYTRGVAEQALGWALIVLVYVEEQWPQA